MGKKFTRSHVSITAPSEDDFIDQKILNCDESCYFDNGDIESMKANEDFPSDAVFKPFDVLTQPYFVYPT